MLFQYVRYANMPWALPPTGGQEGWARLCRSPLLKDVVEARPRRAKAALARAHPMIKPALGLRASVTKSLCFFLYVIISSVSPRFDG